MQKNNLSETHSDKDDWFNYKPPKYKAILTFPLYKSVTSL